MNYVYTFFNHNEKPRLKVVRMPKRGPISYYRNERKADSSKQLPCEKTLLLAKTHTNNNKWQLHQIVIITIIT